MTISDIVQRNDTTPGRIFDSTVIVLILVSIITVSHCCPNKAIEQPCNMLF